MDGMDFRPQPGDTSINIPITFDYKGGRGQNTKGKVIVAIGISVITLIGVIGTASNKQAELYIRCFAPCLIFYIGLFLMRFLVFNELWFSDIYEGLVADDYELKLDSIWQIFDIDFEYPYICYFKNGYKGIFVRMEKDAITGKPDEAMYDHYEAVGDAYNIAHSLNMNICHIDYMDNVGNDARLQKMYDDLAFVENPDMHEMLIDIYSHLQDEMSRNYASFDIYLFMTRDNINNFVYNMQAVCQRMLGGNFITYKVLDRYEIAKVCVALFNLHEFSIVDACENVLQNESSSGIIPISVTHGDGSVEEFNKTIAEKEVLAAENRRKLKEREEEAEKAKAEAKRKRHEARHRKGKPVVEEPKKQEEDEVSLFSEDTEDQGVVTPDSSAEGVSGDAGSDSDNEDLGLF